MNYTIPNMPTISGFAEVESRKFHLHVGKSGRKWLVADQEAAAENVYVEGGPNSDGFGGATLTFPLVSGQEIQLKGPWHGNADALYEDTDVDVRDKHRTFVVIAKDREFKDRQTIMIDVLHKDDAPVLGSFHRGDILARDIAKGLGHSVILYSQSRGGSHCGAVKPDQVFWWEKNQ